MNDETFEAHILVRAMRKFSAKASMHDVETSTRRHLMDCCLAILAESYMRTIEREGYLPTITFEAVEGEAEFQ